MQSVSDGTHETHQERYLLWKGQASLCWLPPPTVFPETIGWCHSHSKHPHTPITVVHTNHLWRQPHRLTQKCAC